MRKYYVLVRTLARGQVNVTIGIAVNLGHAVVMVADGRERNYSKPGVPVCNDDLDKLRVLGNSVGVMTFGVSQLAEGARELLRSKIDDCESQTDLVHASEDSLEGAWLRIWPTLNHADPEDPRLVSGLLLGGFLGDRALIAQTVKSPLQEIPHQIEINVNSFLVAGVSNSDRYRASTFFEVKLLERRYENSSMTNDEVVETAIEDGAKMIAFIGETNSDVGGTIRYLVIRPSGYRKGVYR